MWAKSIVVLFGILSIATNADAQTESPQCPPWNGKFDATEGLCCGTETPCSHYGTPPTWCPVGFSRAYTAGCAAQCECTTASEECGMCCKAAAGKCEAKMPLACPTSKAGEEEFCREPRNFQALKVMGRPNLCAGLANPAAGTGNLALVPCTDAAKTVKLFLTHSKSGAAGMMFVGDVNGAASCNFVGMATGATLKAGTPVTIVTQKTEDYDQVVDWSQTGESGTRGVRAETETALANTAAECASDQPPAKCGGLCMAADLKANTVVLGDCAKAEAAGTLLVGDLQSFATGFVRLRNIFCMV